MNPALLHYYFLTKERLAEAVFRRAAGQLLPAVIRILGSDATLEDKVEQVVEVELQFLSKAPYLPAYILSELAHHPERAPQLIAAVTGEAPIALGTHLRTVLAKQIDARVRDGRCTRFRRINSPSTCSRSASSVCRAAVVRGAVRDR